VFSLAGMRVRPENPGDYPAIKSVNDAAFGQPAEGMMVDALRDNPRFIPELSLVAVDADTVIGHILFFPIDIATDDGLRTADPRCRPHRRSRR
jgi:putative acetyltransferase